MTFFQGKNGKPSPKKKSSQKKQSPVPFGTKKRQLTGFKTSADPNTPNDMLQHFYNRAEMLSEVATNLGSDGVDAISCLNKDWGYAICIHLPC